MSIDRHASRRAIFGAMAVGTTGMTITGVQQVMLEPLVRIGLLSEAQLGLVAMAELYAIAAGIFFGPFFLPRRLRFYTVVVSLLFLAMNLVTHAAGGFAVILFIRLLAGVFGGLLLAAGFIIMVREPAVERVNSIFLVISLIPQVGFAYLIPNLSVARFGVMAGFDLLAALAALTALAALALPRTAAPFQSERADATSIGGWRGAVLVLLIMLANAGAGAVWTYSERLAHALDIPSGSVGIALSAGLASQVLACLIVVWKGWKLPYDKVLPPIWIAMAALALALPHCGTAPVFIATVVAFAFLWMLMQPFHLAAAVRIDPSRKIASRLGCVILVGVGVGPMGVSSVIGRSGLSGAMYLTALVLVLTAVIGMITFRQVAPRHSTAFAA
jgi:DHA1 family inner membrane transport protein